MNRSLRLAIKQATAATSPLGVSRAICAWFVGHADPQDLAMRIVRASRVRRPDGRLWPLRLWDPRVAWHLPFTLNAGRWTYMTQMLPGWHCLDMIQQLCHLAPPSGLAPASPSDPQPYTQAEWELLELVGPINMVLAMAADWGIAPVATNAARVRQLILQCRRLGFSTERDAQVFAACGLTSADDFFQHPPIASALQNAQRRSQSVSAALAPFDESVWQNLRARHGAPQPS